MGRLLRKKLTKKKKKETEDDDSKKSSEVSKRVSTPVVSSSVQKDEQNSGFQQKAKSIKKPKFVEDALRFLREVKSELKKVSWPNRTQTMASTGVVIVLVLIVSVFLGVVDISLSTLMRLAY